MTFHDHQGCIASAMAKADRLCRERGVRFTPIRKKILELVWSNHQSVKAYDLVGALQCIDKAAKPVTVYRALDFLLEQGFIHRIESLNAFVGCGQPDLHHDLLLLICTSCHNVDERLAPGVMQAAQKEIQGAGFEARQQAFEVRGLCRGCR